ncbi:hypothetical protein PUNSTDRAFT_136415 [Punctularia strigosozonata HHB-11173 SS5]|uniref:uncharacterized protein n=1 Tax=Punctularia strigosozonata (strain HHB-11173) TaxID=741275 RepID=UPI0004416B71|nr:uncharacterized protein PUNSTDRAFT_136415 [Punctularia strigosozonata HHB-11173 SS5]EIN06564.1 hypothetical protein PUNSTDRAFT_136415 [Punctularia strigosozonata HHB-11173 SS5]
MSTTRKPQHNSVSIRLTEPVVFLRGGDITGRQRPASSNAPPAMVRGLLVLDIVKPTRITSIEVELVGKSETAWPEGVGARRIEVTEEHKIFSASTVFFRAGSEPSTAASRRTMSLGPGVHALHEDEYAVDDSDSDSELRGTSTPTRDSPHRRTRRRISADQSIFQSEFVSHQAENVSVPPTPPYSPSTPTTVISEAPTPFTLSPRNSVFHSQHIASPARADENPGQVLEESRNALLMGLGSTRTGSRTPLESRASSIRSISPTQRRARGGDGSDAERSPAHSRRPSMEQRRPSFEQPRINGRGLSPMPTEAPIEEEQRRGRNKSRFSLNAMLGTLKERVAGHSRSTSRAVERSVDRDQGYERGRTLEILEKSSGKKKARSPSEERGHGWKEFRKGTYTYPISFAVPANSPPTIHAAFGSVTWRLKAQVHRPGTFKSKLTASKYLSLVACPGEEDMEDQDSIVVQRQWDTQLQYLITVSGRTFFIGGSMPIHITLMPLAKVKVHRVSVFLDERVDYLTQMKRVARSDQPSRTTLLALKHPDSAHGSQPILPLSGELAKEFKRSPLSSIVDPNAVDIDELASSYMGPGPWDIDCSLTLPDSCEQLHFTTKNRQSNISISHTLKIVFRVERGDDQFVDHKTGKRKLFDIVVQMPVHILSCLCGPEMTSLPRYTELFRGSGALTPSCRCHQPRRIGARPPALPRHGSDESVATVASSASDSPQATSEQFERLVAGRVTEEGEAPPSYEVAVGGTPDASRTAH